ncbi:MAG: aspartate aminotransferase family protein [Candidatus Eisenbacteria bacterium]|nr:aspartate aminotransferase family protein [Candidatus Eisenbacteria bacterium]
MDRLLWMPGHEVLVRDIVRAENASLYDSRGRRYVDLESGVWCASVGHGHPRVLRALREQAERIAHAGFSYAAPVVEEAAVEILSLLGMEGGRCVFLCSGSEAVEYGARSARMIAEKPLLMTMADSYFGAYGDATARGAGSWFDLDWFPCAVCPHDGDCSDRCERWASIPFDRIGGFLFEPGSSSGLVRFPPRRLVQNIARAVREGGGLVLVNEVTTGIGRTGAWFGHEHYGIAPDVVAMGKGLGAGYPVSATAFSPVAAERLGGRDVPYAQSHQNDPLGAAVAREVIRLIREEGLVERGREIGAFLAHGLEEIRSRTDRIEEIRSRGLLIAVELRDGAGAPFTAGVHRELARRGFLAARRPGRNVLRIDPPLTIERADVEAFLLAFEETLGGVKATG